MRKTKIICTIGPASSTEEVLTRMCQAGMNVTRLNFSHGSHSDHQEKIDLIKNVRNKLNIPLNYSINKEEVLNLIKNDKKRNNDKISLIKINYIERYVIEDVNLETIERMLERGE